MLRHVELACYPGNGGCPRDPETNCPKWDAVKRLRRAVRFLVRFWVHLWKRCTSGWSDSYCMEGDMQTAEKKCQRMTSCN